MPIGYIQRTPRRDIERGAAVAAELRRLAADAAFLVPV